MMSGFLPCFFSFFKFFLVFMDLVKNQRIWELGVALLGI